MAQIILDHVEKAYAGGAKAVNDLSLDVLDGEFMVFVGPSGCGKSTALRSIAGLEEITGGTIQIGDRVVNDLPPKDRDIAMVFQNYALYPHMTVEQNLAFGLQLRKTSKDEIKRRVDEAAQMLGLEQYLKRKPAALSGGQRQRVAMGRAIVREPQAFLMDEPLSNLDAKLRVSMRGSLKQLHERLGVTTVYVTHDQVEAMTLGNRVCVLRDEPAAAGRHAAASVRGAGEPVRGRLYRLARDELRHRGPGAGRRPGGHVRRVQARGAGRRDGGQARTLGLHRQEGHPRHPALRLRGCQPGRRLPSGEDAHHRRRHRGARHRDPRDLHHRRAPGRARGPHEGGQTGDDEDEAVSALVGGKSLWTARVSARSRIQPGQPAGLAVDTHHLHFFDPASGLSLGHPQAAAALVGQ